MQRDHWIFEYTAESLNKATIAKIQHHQNRLKFWMDAKEATLKEVRESGIEVDEGIDVGIAYSNKSRGPRVLVRTDLQGKLEECAQKIMEHGGRIREYEGWSQVLSSDPGKRLALNADDYLFFFGK